MKWKTVSNALELPTTVPHAFHPISSLNQALVNQSNVKFLTAYLAQTQQLVINVLKTIYTPKPLIHALSKVMAATSLTVFLVLVQIFAENAILVINFRLLTVKHGNTNTLYAIQSPHLH